MIPLRSKITITVLDYFFLNPQDALYVNELSRKLDLDKRNLVKKIKELENEGVLTSQVRGNLRLYSLNPHYPLLKELKSILRKTSGFEDKLRNMILITPGVKTAYIYGSYAQDKLAAHSDIDLLVIGDHKVIDLQKELTKLQKETGREINTTNISEQEFAKRRRQKDPFISGILKQKNIKIEK